MKIAIKYKNKILYSARQKLENFGDKPHVAVSETHSNCHSISAREFVILIKLNFQSDICTLINTSVLQEVLRVH